MVRCPRCGYEFDLKRSNKLRQIMDYMANNDGVKLHDLQNHFREKWGCSNTVITNLLKKLGREKIIKVTGFRVYMVDEWLLKQKKLKGKNLS